MDYLGEPNIITDVLKGERQEGQSQRDKSEDTTLLTLKVEEGAVSQGKQITEARKSKKTESPPEPPEGIQFCQHLN